MMDRSISGRPAATEYAEYYGPYIARVDGDDAVAALQSQLPQTIDVLSRISDEKSLFRYAEGKWSIREVVGHMIDAERVMAYRALRFARNDPTPAAGFEENDFVAAADFDRRSLESLIDEFSVVRRSSVLLFQHLKPGDWLLTGVANDHSVSVRGIAFIIAGHELHHIGIVRERYLGG